MILTEQDAREILGYGTNEEMPARVTTILLPAIDRYLQDSTGKDWGTITVTYASVDPTAKMAASVLLTRWFDDPAQTGSNSDIGITSLITQLEAKALQEAQAVVVV